MGTTYSIHPSIGVARLGNSGEDDPPGQFYIAPEEIGGLPIECDAQGNEIIVNGKPKRVEKFKDDAGRVKRQAARFKIFKCDDSKRGNQPVEVTLDDADIKKIEWSVHVANKKAIWYQFSELEGNLLLGEWTKVGGRQENSNSYKTRNISVNNSDVTKPDDRKRLIIDPGPRRLDGPGQKADFSRDTIPPNYKYGSFPTADPAQGTPINTLGEMLTDKQGRLLVLGGFGHAGGNQTITSFAGANSWHDDISDGQVSCTLTLKNGKKYEMHAWVLAGSPKFAPELVNIVTLDDLMFDVGVRFLNMIPEMYDLKKKRWNEDYKANYKRDVEPIIRRPLDYVWVANVPSMAAFAAPHFDTRDPAAKNRPNRETYFSLFRNPGSPPQDWGQVNQLTRDPSDNDATPLMPLNSGSNSVSNTLIDKFVTLTQTQYFLLGQWAKGKFTTDDPDDPPGIHPLDHASVGNCVGLPMCPGIEVTWSTQNPPLYSAPFQIRHRFAEDHYFKHGLSIQDYDETDPFNKIGGCEPGDLTKRMAIPWQADFFQCTVQFINFTDPRINKDDGIPAPPTYYGYWWPPQSPMFVMSGYTTLEDQAASGVPAGFQVYFPRGINSFAQMISAWSYMGFIVNENRGPQSRDYPNFVEKERNNDRFVVSSVAVGDVSNFVNATDVIFWPAWYLRDEQPKRETAMTLALPGARRGRVRSPQTGRTRSHHED